LYSVTVFILFSPFFSQLDSIISHFENFVKRQFQTNFIESDTMLKISELIQELESVIDEYGDMFVYFTIDKLFLDICITKTEGISPICYIIERQNETN